MDTQINPVAGRERAIHQSVGGAEKTSRGDVTSRLTILDVPEPWRTPELATAILRVGSEALGPRTTPRRDQIFRALQYFEPSETKFVILGQDPYASTSPQGIIKANGLAFGAAPGYTGVLQDSLYNIRCAVRAGGCGELIDPTLESWARQGVLLLNSALTTELGYAGAHSKIGWARVVQEILCHVRDVAPDAVWMVWGRHARNLVCSLPGGAPKTMRIASHPSPMSADTVMGGHPAFNNSHMFRAEDTVLWGDTAGLRRIKNDQA